MSKYKKMIAAIVAAIAAIAAFFNNVGDIRNATIRWWLGDPDLSLEIAETNHQLVTWSSGAGIPTGEVSYVANIHISKKGTDSLNNCKFSINIGNGFIWTPEAANRSIPRGVASFDMHYEHKIPKKEFHPDVILQLRCDGFSSKPINIKFQDKQ